MDEIAKLLKEKADLAAKAEAMADGAKAGERDLTEDEAAKIDEMIARMEAIDEEVKGLEAKAKRDAYLVGLKKAPERRSAPDTPDQPGKEPDPRIDVGRDLREEDLTAGFRTPREFILAVVNQGMGRQVDERLKLLAAAGSDEHGEYSDPHGGFLVPAAFAPTILQIAPQDDPMGALVTRIPMASPKVEFAARVDKDHSTSVSGGLRVYRRAEADTSASSRMAHKLVKLEAAALMGIAFATEELLRDSPVSFAALLAVGFRDEFTSRLISERIRGTGVGEFTGVLNSACLVTASKYAGQAADTIITENVLAMRARIWGYDKAIWLANQTLIPQLPTMTIDVGTGGVAVYMPSVRADVPEMLLGRPIIFTQYCSALGDLGDIILCNWSQYLEGTRQGLKGDVSIHVRFIYNEQTFRFTMENDGAPWWESDLTPKYGDTLSPFVTLEAR